MNTQFFSTAVRRYPRKPVQSPAVPQPALYASKETDAEAALHVLKSFYTEARKEIRKNEKSRVTMNAENGISQVVICLENVTLSLIAS